MKSAASKTRTRLASLLLGVAMLPVHAGEREGMHESLSFNEYDADKNGVLSLLEFQDRGKDDLSFRAADINGDERVDPQEFDRYVSKLKALDAPASGSGDAGQQRPAPTPGGN